MQAPVGEDERVTLEALKAEARCIGRSGGGKEEPSTTMGRLKAELNILQVCMLLSQGRVHVRSCFGKARVSFAS